MWLPRAEARHPDELIQAETPSTQFLGADGGAGHGAASFMFLFSSLWIRLTCYSFCYNSSVKVPFALHGLFVF